jgi:hypothetical protein
MIISASRRTDIPACYSDWFFRRMSEGYVLVKNPVNPHQVSRVSLSRDVVDAIVFWTKNPIPMMDRLQELKDYMYYFQFTLTGYGKDIEPNLPSKKNSLIPAFRALSRLIGKERVVWRYDPILLTKTYSLEYHLNAFEEIARRLCGYTDECIISFVDSYKSIQERVKELHPMQIQEEEIHTLASAMSTCARNNGMRLSTCSEQIDLSAYGIEHAHCIDKERLERLLGCPLSLGKGNTGRLACGCAASVDIGAYDTCSNGCVYCYANHDTKTIQKKSSLYDPNAPLLCNIVSEHDWISERRQKTSRNTQISFL